MRTKSVKRKVLVICVIFFTVSLLGCKKKETETEDIMKEPTQKVEEITKETFAEGEKTPTKAPEPTETSQKEIKEPTKEPTPIPTVSPLLAQFGNPGDTFMNETEIFEKIPASLTKKRNDVSYGEIIKTTYYSNTCEKDRNVIVLLPSDYSEEKQYPVLYVLHGIFGNETSMIGDGNSGIRVILGNMIADGLTKEMIVVFPHMYASKTQADCTAIDLENTLAYDNFVNDLADDLIPFIESTYSAAKGRDNTGLIGFSMGGRETLAIAFQRPDLIGYACGISPAPGLTPGTDFAMFHPGQFTEEELLFPEGEPTPKLLMVCCGTADTVVGKFPLSYHEIMQKNGIGHVWWEINGSGHGDPAISSGYYNFFNYVFQ